MNKPYMAPGEQEAAERVMMQRLTDANGEIGILDLTKDIPYSTYEAYEPARYDAELQTRRATKIVNKTTMRWVLDEWLAAGKISKRGGCDSAEGGPVLYSLVRVDA